MDTFRIIAFTHKQLPLELIGKLQLQPDDQSLRLPAAKQALDLSELMYLATCNRVELLFRSAATLPDLLSPMLEALFPGLSTGDRAQLADKAEVYTGSSAIEHLLKVTSSLDSMVVGEREIITQVRKAYESCRALGVTGDFLRLAIRQAVETAKEIFTNTGIARHQVSVASLAYRQLRDMGVKNSARILFVGSGETNTALASYFRKHQFANFAVFNRTLANAERLASALNGTAHDLAHLQSYAGGFDVLVTCVASPETIITPSVFDMLCGGETGGKVIIDLALPSNVDAEVASRSNVQYIDISSLQSRAEANLQLRRNELIACEEIVAARSARFRQLLEERRIELAFGDVPGKVKAIRETAVNEVFAREISSLDMNGQEVLSKVLAYMEKKYNAVAIKTAKEVMLATRE